MHGLNDNEDRKSIPKNNKRLALRKQMTSGSDSDFSKVTY
jgi:hypothetical protein